MRPWGNDDSPSVVLPSISSRVPSPERKSGIKADQIFKFKQDLPMSTKKCFKIKIIESEGQSPNIVKEGSVVASEKFTKIIQKTRNLPNGIISIQRTTVQYDPNLLASKLLQNINNNKSRDYLSPHN